MTRSNSPGVPSIYAASVRNGGHQACALRLLGDIHAQQEPPEVEQAEGSYQQAMRLAEELGMGPLQAHCYLGLGLLSARLGRRAQACTELSAAIELHRAMDMTFWPDWAEAALAALRQTAPDCHCAENAAVAGASPPAAAA